MAVLDFLRILNRKPSIILLVQFHNEIERLPGFFTSVLPHVDGIIGLNDGSSDGSADYFSAQPKVLTVIHRPIRDPHHWDEPANRRALIKASHHYQPDWILALDVDERLDKHFRRDANRSIQLANLARRSVISLRLYELWDSPSTYRMDGIWGKKRRNRLFRWAPDHQISNVALHGPWTSTAIHAKTKSLKTGLCIYHLGMISEDLRIKRVERYRQLDPKNQYQSIGYDYLNDKTNFRLGQIAHDRHPQIESIEEGALSHAPFGLCTRALKRYLHPDFLLPSQQSKSKDFERVIGRIRFCLKLLPPAIRSNHVPSFILSGWCRVGKTNIAQRLCRSNGLCYLPLDPFSAIYQGVKDYATRQFIKKTLVRELLKRYPTGIILDGADLVFDNYFRSDDRPKPTLDFLHELSLEHPVKIYLIGNAKDTLTEKIDGIKKYRFKHPCWTLNSHAWSEDKLEDRAKEIISASQLLRDQSNSTSLTYIDIHSGSFHHGVIRAQALIEQQELSPFFTINLTEPVA